MINKIRKMFEDRRNRKIDEQKAISRIDYLCEVYNAEKKKQKQGMRNKADELQRILLRAIKTEGQVSKQR